MKDFTALYLLEWFALITIIAAFVWFVIVLSRPRTTQPWHKTSSPHATT